MEIVNLLNFLNSTKRLFTLDYATCSEDYVDFLNLITDDIQFTQKINLGIFYLNKRMNEGFTVIDGASRILSLSLLLHAICECYKKTTQKNEKAIRIIRKKYLISENKAKLRLPRDMQEIYDKILFGQRLSGKEKESSIFKLLHKYWSQIKANELQASEMFMMLRKVYVYMVNAENISKRDLYYAINSKNRVLNQTLLIKDYLQNLGIQEYWEQLEDLYDKNSLNINQFFKEYFVTKYKIGEYSDDRLYEIFVNYFETMLQYIPDEDVLISKIIKTAKLYINVVNVNLYDDKLNYALIKIKKHKGEDTYAYILNIYEDYVDNNISLSSFEEILLTIDEYLQKRLQTPNHVEFNELVNYLNAFITCK